ncbi:protein kinase domain-containing protein [Tsukamurella sp. DT100]|uniref:serine/threonine-protein kinase n=1 Tax=Tsukamurella sp. DT100 TaxID=3393415 RepID=UPI003CF46A04
MAFEQGDVVAGYVIERLLGVGGMGEVYVARHPRLPRSDALKVLAPQFAMDPQFRARFEREADLAAGLSHHSIVSVHDRGEFDGHLWMALELIDGRDVGALLRGSPRGIAGAEAVRIVSAVADALDYAGARGLIHRDVKPANILLSSAGGVLLTDFGIARMGPENSELTATGTTVGTMNYSSPEQLRGDVLDPRSDQYALAATTFHLLTGGVPFADTNAGAVIIAHATRPVPSVRTARPDLPPAVDQVIARGMAKDPQQRFPTAKAFAQALAAAVPQDAVGAPVVDTVGVDSARTVVQGEIPPDAATVVPGPRLHAAQRSRKRGPVLAGIAVVLVIAVVVGVVVIVRGAADGGGDQVAVSPEARSLTPALATPLLKSLNSQPGRSRWVYAAPAGFNFGSPRIDGGDDRRVLVGVTRYAPAPSSYTNPAVDIVDAASGQSTGIVDLSPSLGGLTQCAMVADTAACVAYEARGDNKHLIMIDVAAKRVTADHVFRKFGDVFASGNLFAANAYIPPDGPTVTSRSYRLDGTEAWRVGPRLSGEKERTEDQFVPDVGIAVTSFTAEAADPLSAETDGTRVFRISDGKKLYEGARSSVLAYRGGFAVTPKGSIGTVGSVQFYDLDGNALAAADGGWTVADAPRTVGGGHQQASPPLPVLVRNDQGRTVIGVFNPATGTELWRRAVDAPIGSMQVQGVGSKIVIRGNRSTFAYDAYTADETSVGSNRDDPILGTDGSRVAAWKRGSGNGGMIIVSDRPGEPGWSMSLDAQPAVIGSGLYTSGDKPARIL